MPYTISQLATLAGITPRTLRHYDAIGLLCPAYTQKNGYRMYGHAELLQLQQILFFKELDMPLKDITAIMNARHHDERHILRDQKKLLQLRAERLQNLIQTIDKTIKHMDNDTPMNDAALYAHFDDEHIQTYAAEAKKRWGGTPAHTQSMDRLRRMTNEDIAAVKKETQDIANVFAEHMHLPADDKIVQSLVDRHHASIEVWYDCTPVMYRDLADMYVQDERFASFYNKTAPGLATFIKDAIHVWCDTHGQKNGGE